MNYKRQIKEAAFRLQSILPERELDHCSTELIFLETQHILTQRCLWRACILLQKVMAPSFGSFDHRGNWCLSSHLLAKWYKCDHIRNKPFQGKGRQFYMILLTFSQMLHCPWEREALQVWDRWQCACLPATLWPAFHSVLSYWMVGIRPGLVLRPHMQTFYFPKCIVCRTPLWVFFFKLVWDYPDSRVNPCLGGNQCWLTALSLNSLKTLNIQESLIYIYV